MKLGILFSGGKDSMYAAYLAKKEGSGRKNKIFSSDSPDSKEGSKSGDYEISCLISIESKNKESYMFHTPSISRVREQARVMGIPLIVVRSKGEKEKELDDLGRAIKKAVRDYKIEGIVSGAVESVYQSSRIQKICNELDVECFNPLWQKGQKDILDELIRNKFEVIVSGVFAYPIDEKWLGRKIDREFVREIVKLNEKYEINVAGEGGEFESFVLNCPLFKKRLKVVDFRDFGEGNSWRREVKVR
tara:strand:- start:1913 stop:2650 length:738 start_codon:yes stop_codon:yes gene_type:complete